jgi:hypothetical protein
MNIRKFMQEQLSEHRGEKVRLDQTISDFEAELDQAKRRRAALTKEIDDIEIFLTSPAQAENNTKQT